MAPAGSSLSSSGMEKALVTSNSKGAESSQSSAPAESELSAPVSSFFRQEVHKAALPLWEIIRIDNFLYFPLFYFFCSALHFRDPFLW